MTEEIEEKRVNIRTAILAKEKGFNLHCDWCYNEHCVEEQVGNINFVDDDKYITFSSPRQTLLQKWLREVHKLYVIPDIIYDDKNWQSFFYKIEDMNTRNTIQLDSKSKFYIRSYEQALEEGLFHALNLIKK